MLKHDIDTLDAICLFFVFFSLSDIQSFSLEFTINPWMHIRTCSRELVVIKQVYTVIKNPVFDFIKVK